jgi:hypothetical protein
MNKSTEELKEKWDEELAKATVAGSKNIVPIGARIMVGDDSGEKVSAGGIILTQRADQMKIKSGKVLAIGNITM